MGQIERSKNISEITARNLVALTARSSTASSTPIRIGPTVSKHLELNGPNIHGEIPQQTKSVHRQFARMGKNNISQAGSLQGTASLIIILVDSSRLRNFYRRKPTRKAGYR